MEDFSVSTSASDGSTVVQARGDIDVHSAPELRAELLEQIARGHRHLVIDLSAVTFLDSSALGVLVGAMKRVRDDGGWVRLVCPDQRLLKIFRITGLTRVFSIYDTTEAALRETG